MRADAARAAWDSVQARQAVAYARSVAFHSPTREALVPGAPVARLVIPRIGLDEIVLEGVDGDELNAGPGHVSGTVFPGEPGNSVISAHRDRHFNHFDALDVGDTLSTESESGARTWIIVSTRVIGKDDPALFTHPRRDAHAHDVLAYPLPRPGTRSPHHHRQAVSSTLPHQQRANGSLVARPYIRVLPHIAAALDAGTPVVALESSVLAQGLPIPQNREAAERMVAAVEAAWGHRGDHGGGSRCSGGWPGA